MAIDNVTDLVGERGDSETWKVEEGKVREFAVALGFDDPRCLDLEAARAAGLDGLLAPPTFAMASTFWMRGTAPLRKAEFDRKRVLHGEQEFVCHKPLVSGMVLEGVPEIVDVRQKEGKRGGMMTFVTTEIVWREKDSGDPVVSTSSTILETAPAK
ncbi:MAG: MaoC family dehydratase N-terminal domain-containing protein [Acidimicrobiia bacterium]|nr:MaoC family dehydratase N-terminal domain-containing protein [Acidimicrobiia bacterium]